jgi:heme-degrading monooxygenase HmoA
VTLRLKRDRINDFKRIAETEILPLLRRQTGFRDEVLSVAPERFEALAIGFWDTKEAHDAFEKTAYPNIVNSVSNLLEETPKVETFELLFSTPHKLTAKA